MRAICTALAAAVVALALAGGASPMGPSKVFGTVGPGFTITLKKGVPRAPVRTLKAGRYTFVVSDRSAIHNFVIEGPGFERAITTVGFVGTKTVTIVLKRGSWKFYCRPHESAMFGHFRVT